MKTKQFMFPLLVAIGVGGYYLFIKKKDSEVETPVLPYDPIYDQPTVPDKPVLEYKPTQPGSVIISNNDPMAKQYFYGITSGLPQGLSNPLVPKLELLNGRQLMYLYSISSYIPATSVTYWNAFVNMTETQLASVWAYVSGYLSNNKPLLNATKKNPDGSWDNSNPGNPDLYNQITAIHNLYGIF